MKNIALAFTLASGLVLSGCATSGTVPTSGVPGPVATDSQITAIQQTAVRVCGFLPAVQTVAAIVATFTGGGEIVGLAGNVARAICNAVTINPLADGPGAKNYKPTVRGVRIQGGFTR